MVCLPCIVIPVLLWVFHKFIQPWIIKYCPWMPFIGSKKTPELSTVQFSEDMLATDEGKYVKENIDKHPVMVFSKTTCSYCKMAKKMLNEIGVNYEVDEIQGKENMTKIQDLFEKITGERTVPRIFIGGKTIGGASDAMTLHNEGKLVPLMKEAGATFKDKST